MRVAPALGRREMIADRALQFADAPGEGRQVRLHQRRQHLQQGRARQLRRNRGRELRQAAEGLALGAPGQARGGARRQQQDDAPVRGKYVPGDDRRRAVRAASAVDQEAAVHEGTQADARARAAAEAQRDFARRQVQPEQPRRGGARRQRQLRAGAESGVARNGAMHLEAHRVREVVGRQQPADVLQRRVSVGAGGGELRRAAAGQRDAELLERHAEAAKAPPEAAVQVDEAQVQAGRSLDLDSLVHGRTGAEQRDADSIRPSPRPTPGRSGTAAAKARPRPIPAGARNAARCGTPVPGAASSA